MLRRTLASVFLLTLLLAQTLTGICHAQCNGMSPNVAASCHSMNMDTGTDHVAADCTSHPCTSDMTLFAERHPAQQDLSSHLVDPPAVSSVERRLVFAIRSDAASPPNPCLASAPSVPASTRKTALRV